MTKEQMFFIQILADHLNGRETKCNDVLDWNIIYDYARKHQVSGIVYTQAKNYMPAETLNVFRQETIATVYNATIRNNDFATVTKALNENKIPNFIIKGPAVAALFPNTKLRSMGDIDLVVKHEDREKCHNIIINSGYKCVSKQDDREWQYYKKNMEMELHDRLVYDEAVNEKGQDEFFNDCWQYVHEGQLDWNFHLLFLIFHLRKHFMNSGVGFRMFMDLAVVAEKAHIDWYILEDNLKKTGMFEFAKKCYGFIGRWFGIHIPLYVDIDDIFFEEATQKIFTDGVFGFDNSENKGSEVFNKTRNQRFLRLSMGLLALRQIFPNIKELREIETYAYLKKYPFLLSVSWMHRIFRGLKKHKENIGINSIKKSFIMNDQIKRRESMLQKWGL